MVELDEDKIPVDYSTHIRLWSGTVRDFNLTCHGDESEDKEYQFGFTMKKDKFPFVTMSATDEDEDDTEVWVILDKKGLESLITFLNKLCKDEK
jgi:hypothetical protein